MNNLDFFQNSENLIFEIYWALLTCHNQKEKYMSLSFINGSLPATNKKKEKKSPLYYKDNHIIIKIHVN